MTVKRIDGRSKTGTSYKGLLRATYPELVAMFGQPDKPSGDGKVQASWTLEIAGCVLATIYDYKEDQKPRTLLQWHIGGKTSDVVQLIDLVIKEKRKEFKT